MSSEIGLNDVKPGMWVEFDDADGHYAGELHEMKNSESMVDGLIMSMGHKPPLYIETEDEGFWRWVQYRFRSERACVRVEARDGIRQAG